MLWSGANPFTGAYVHGGTCTILTRMGSQHSLVPVPFPAGVCRGCNAYAICREASSTGLTV